MLQNFGSVILIVLTAGLLQQNVPAQTTDTVSIDPDVRYQVLEGFGEGSMDQRWPVWYEQYNAQQREEILDLLYTLDGNGLGLRICRAPMPVGDAPGHDHFDRLPDQANQPFEPEEGVFTWDGHENILWHIQGAQQRGATMWAYWYSVPYWLTVSGCTAGSVDGSSNNLIAGEEARFVQHICDVLVHFRDFWGVEWDYVSGMNEPEADWWKYGGGQPGCHVSSDQCIIIIDQMQTQLPARGLDTEILAYDAAFTNSVWYLDDLLESSIEPALSIISCHQYSTSDWGMGQWYWRSVQYDKTLWMSEWGDWTNGGYPYDKPYVQAMNYANKIHRALKLLHAEGWVMWESEFLLDEPAEGVVPRKSYWAVAQYSRHVRPGMQLVESTDSADGCKTTVWVDTTDSSSGRPLVMVTVNDTDSAALVQYDLSDFSSDVTIEEVRRTSETEDYAQISFEQPADRTFNATAPAGSVLTVSAKIHRCPSLSAEKTDDCIVDLSDLQVFATYWLQSAGVPCPELIGDATGDCVVDLVDFCAYGEQWERIPAFNPVPEDGATDVNPDGRLEWASNFYAVAHDVYIGTDRTSVVLADRNWPQFKGTLGETQYRPLLDPEQQYYWRIDEVTGSGRIQKGEVWTFTTGARTVEPQLAGWWKLDESGGSTAADSSLAGNDGTLEGDPVWQPAGGVFGGAIELDGNGDAVAVPDFLLTTDTATFTGWINGWKASDWAGIVYSRSDVACGMHFGGDDRLHYTWNQNTRATYAWSGGPVIPQNEWAMIAVVVEPNEATAYVYTTAGGLQQGINNLPHIPQTLDNLKIGRDSQDNVRYFQGLIDDVRIYSRALGPDEIAALAGAI